MYPIIITIHGLRRDRDDYVMYIVYNTTIYNMLGSAPTFCVYITASARRYYL